MSEDSESGDEGSGEYAYPEREIDPSTQKAFVPGEGRISGYISAILGISSFLGVLCFKYPSWLTTPEFRAAYDLTLLRQLLAASIWTSLAFGLFTFLRRQNKRKGATGIAFTLVALAMGGWEVQLGELKEAPFTVGVDWLVLSVLMSSVFVVIEKAWPKYAEQAITRPAWRLDLLYFTMNTLAVGILLLAGNKFAPAAFGWAIHDGFQSWVQSLPLALQVFLLLFCADFVFYWMHRIFHTVPWLWRFHAVHHSTMHMDWLASSRTHFLETLVDRSMVMVPLYLLGTSTEALDIYAVWIGFQAVFIHANVGIPTGPLKYLLVTPQFHHWHHSSQDPALDTNYAATFPWFDWVFGTYHLPEEHWPAAYGTVTPIPETFVGHLVHPFVKNELVPEKVES
ncbi:MAG: sterol desaturase family protein [Alphaproteobacteria bacterium]|nr:sterol desaturase family protein [Alphaproteobacteria bacterium]